MKLYDMTIYRTKNLFLITFISITNTMITIMNNNNNNNNNNNKKKKKNRNNSIIDFVNYINILFY